MTAAAGWSHEAKGADRGPSAKPVGEIPRRAVGALPSPALTVSPDGAAVPGIPFLVDAQQHKFALVDIDPATKIGMVTVDGKKDGETASLLYAHGGTVYAAARGTWFLWRNGQWFNCGRPEGAPESMQTAIRRSTPVGTPTRSQDNSVTKAAGSVDGLAVPPLPQLTDEAGNVFQLTDIDPATATGIVVVNGTKLEKKGSMLVVYGGKVFAVTSGGAAAFYRDGIWITAGLPNGAPGTPQPPDAKPSNAIALGLPRGMPIPAGGPSEGAYVPLVVKMPVVAPTPIPQPAPIGMWATLTFADGKSFIFRQDTATDRSTYDGEFVHVRSFEARNVDLPAWTVLFRIDEPGQRKRHEAVFEYGDIWGWASQAVQIFRPYTVTIGDGPAVLATQVVPYHWWLSRWRWQEWARAIVRTPAELITKGWVPNLSTAGAMGTPGQFKKKTYSEPMDWAGLTTAMAQVGDREDIGEVTEAQGRYLATGDPIALSSLLAQGEAGGTMPNHVRDPRTGAQVDLVQYPDLTVTTTNPGNPQLRDATAPPPAPDQAGAAGLSGAPYDARYFRIDVNHTPGNAAVPFMLTDDPYFLEELENQGLWGVGVTDHYRRTQGVPFLAFPLEDRGWAWSMRNLFELATLAPAQPPAWLKSRSYWQRMVDQNGEWMDRYIASPALVHRVFRAFPRSAFGDSWMKAFEICAIAQFVQSGHPEWLGRLRWAGAALITMVNGDDGWHRQFPAPYEIYYGPDWNSHPFRLLVDGTSEDATTFSHWGQAWDYMVAQRRKSSPAENWNTETWDGHTLMNAPWNSFQYVAQVRAALVAMLNAGVSDANAGVNYLNSELPKAEALNNGWAGFRWAYTMAVAH